MRIGNYEDGVTGRHDAAQDARRRSSSRFLARAAAAQRVAVLLHDAGSVNKVAQTLLEMMRGGIGDLPVDVTVFYGGRSALDARFVGRLPFARAQLAGGDRADVRATRVRGGRLRLRHAVRIVRHVSRRGRRRPGVAPGGRAARRGLGQPPAVGARHRGVVSAALSPATPCSGPSATSAATC